MVPYPRGVGQVGRNLLSAAWSLEVWPRVSSLWRQYGLPSRRSQVHRPLFVGRSPSVTLFLVAFRRSFSIGSFHVGLFSLGQILSLLCIPSVALCWSFSVGRFPSVAAIGRFSVGLLSGSYVLSGGGVPRRTFRRLVSTFPSDICAGYFLMSVPFSVGYIFRRSGAPWWWTRPTACATRTRPSWVVCSRCVPAYT